MRTSNWPVLLARFIEERKHNEFDWKTNNCAYFACDWIKILTGEDLGASFREKVACERTAAEALSPYGGLVGLIEFEAKRLGWVEQTAKMAKRGDIGVHTRTTGQPAIGVVLGKDMATPGRYGLEYIPVSQGIKFWSID
jgi:hypothetical protein